MHITRVCHKRVLIFRVKCIDCAQPSCSRRAKENTYLFFGEPQPHTSMLSNLYGTPQWTTCWNESSTSMFGFLGSLPALMPFGYPRIDVFKYMDFGPPGKKKKSINLAIWKTTETIIVNIRSTHGWWLCRRVAIAKLWCRLRPNTGAILAIRTWLRCKTRRPLDRAKMSTSVPGNWARDVRIYT